MDRLVLVISSDPTLGKAFEERENYHGAEKIFRPSLGVRPRVAKGSKYRLIPMNSQVRDALLVLCRDRASDEFVLDEDVNEVNDYALRWGSEEACLRAGLRTSG